MFELAQNLILNEDALNSLPEKQRSIFIYEWLYFLNKVLGVAQKNDIRDCQSQIVQQLLQQIYNQSNPPIRILIGRNLAALFSIEDRSSLLINTINHCIDILRTNDRVAQLTIVVILGALYERLDRSFEEIVPLLLKILKNGDSQIRCEVLHTLKHIINGLGSTARTIHREVHKIAKAHLSDRTMSIRSAAAACLIALINENNFMYSSELEGNLTSGFRALEGSNYEVRCSVAKYIAILLAASQGIFSDSVNNINRIKAEEPLRYLSEGFLYGNLNFLKCTTTEPSKGPTRVLHEIRVGITYTYVELIRILGTTWIEQNLSLCINHLLELAGSSGLSTSHLDTIFSRQCITFILRSVIGSHLTEKVQFDAAKELTMIVTRIITPQSMANLPALTNDSNISSMNSSTNSMTQSYGSTTQFQPSNTECQENILVCALYELSFLIQSLGSSTLLLLQDSCNGLIDTLFLVILHPSQSVRIATARCFRSIAIALPSLMTPFIDQCLTKINDLAKELNTSNVDAMSGLALLLQTLLGAVHQCPLGIPSQYAKTIFDFANNLLRTTIALTTGQEQSLIPHLILQRTSTAWHLLSACCTLDQHLLKKFLPHLIPLWRNVFPRSLADFEQEKQRGDSLTWILSLSQRSGALCSMISFLNHSSNLLSDDILKRLMNAIIILFHTPHLIRQFGQQLKISTTIFRLRLYELLLLIPTQSYEQHFSSLLRELMSEFTLVDSSLNTTTSLLRSVCYNNGHFLLGNLLQETNDQVIEEQLHPHSTTSFGALEHDETYLYRRNPVLTSFNIVHYLFPSSSDNSSNLNNSLSIELNLPEPLPLNIAVIDISIRLYSKIFTHLSNQYRSNMFQHFLDLIKQSRDARQEAIQTNILTAVLLSFKTLTETKQVSSLDANQLQKCVCTLVIPVVNHSNPALRCAAAETLGCLIQILPDECLIENSIRFCFDHLKESRDVQSQTGYSLALACLYHSMDDINREQYLDLFISVLRTLIENQSTANVQIWALHALILIAESSKDMLRNYTEPLLELVLDLLLSSSSSSQVDIYRCCGRLLNTLITNMDQDSRTNINSISSCLIVINLLQMHIEPVVQAETVHALQQLHLFTPRHVHLSMLVPILIQGLTNRDLSLRRTCLSCLKQLAQRKAKEIPEHATVLFTSDLEQNLSSEMTVFRSLEALLFSILNMETDAKICLDIQEILLHMLQAFEPDHLTHWLRLCNDILAATTENSNSQPSSSDNDRQRTKFSASSSNSNLNSENDDDVSTDDDEQLQATTDRNIAYRSTSSIKWQTKVFAIDCIQKLIKYCEQTPQSIVYLDSTKEHLVTYLPVLITSSFLACRSTYDPLRLSGLSLLKQIILQFAHTEKNVDRRILKQCQAQIGAALRPAFSRRISSHVTAQACDVCRIWILSEVVSDLSDLRRIHQLLISSLQKFTSIQQQFKTKTNMIYNESALTIENLAILKLWADVYNFAVGQRNKSSDCNLLLLIQTELYIVVHHWLAVLTDYARLMLPKEFNRTNGTNFHSGNFYSTESDIDITRTVYKATWVSVMQATTQWLAENHYELETSLANHKQRDIFMAKLLASTLGNKTRKFPEKKEDIFAMLLGCCVHTLSISISEQTDETIERILVSLIYLLRSNTTVSQITMEICLELIRGLIRLSLVRADIKIHLEIIKVLEILFPLSSSCTLKHPIVNKDLLIPDEPFLSAVLELLVSILLNYFPINQNNTNNLQIIELITSVIPLLHELIRLSTTNQNIQQFHSILLHLLLSISFVLFSNKSDQQKALLSRIFQSIEHLFSTSISQTISHDAIVTIMNLRANLMEKDSGYFVRCLTSVIRNSNSIKLTKQIIDFYRKAFDDRDSETHFHLLQCLNELFQSRNLSLRNKFIQIFTPLLIIELKQTDEEQQIMEILKIFEGLLSVVDSTLRLRLASSIIPLFIHFLPDSTFSNVRISAHLTTYITERLEHFLSIYPNEFRFVLKKSPDLQSKLEHK